MRFQTLLCLLAIFCLSSASIARGGDSSRPNIVIILADDMGFSDAGCFGGEIRTPNIDWLAKQGLRFTQFYNTARCCPTRASLLTGQYPHRVGLDRNGQSLRRNCVTIAEVLRSVGYQTGMVGKWHLSRTPVLADNQKHQDWLDHRHDPKRPFADLETYPVNRGFDKHFGIIWGVVNYFDPFSLVEGTKAVEKVPDDFYITDAITEKAVEYIHDFAKKDQPFFLYIAHCAPHWPLHARAEDIARYQDRYDKGWHQLRQERYQRQLNMGLFAKENTPLPPLMGKKNNNKNWQNLTKKEKAFMANKMAVHAAMVDRMDQGIGKVLDALRETKELDNTLILFLSDNGASPEVPTRPGYDRSARTRDGKEIQYQGDFIPGSQLTYTGIGPFWANALNTPFRFWKPESFAGGNQTAMIAFWPKGLKTKPGAITTQVGHVIDIMPTCINVANAKYPTSYQGHKIHAMDGKSLLPILQGKMRAGHDTLYFEHVGGRAIRRGDWKLAAPINKRKDWQLFNLSKDRSESQNLADQYPERVRELSQAWERWHREIMPKKE